jgi:hypothetical protein
MAHLSGAIASKQPGKAFPLQAATGTPETEKPSAVFTALGFMFLAERESEKIGFQETSESLICLGRAQAPCYHICLTSSLIVANNRMLFDG